MKFQPLLFSLLLSTALYAQKTLQEIRVEENIFIMKIVGVVVLFLVAMPFVLRKLKAGAQVQVRKLDDRSRPAASKVKAAPSEARKVLSKVNTPLDTALDKLMEEHRVPQEERAHHEPLYRRYLEVKFGKIEIKTGSFDFNAILDALSTKLHLLETERNFEIVFEMDANVPPQMIGDSDRLTEILLYILQSALRKQDTHLLELHIKRLNLGDEAVHLEFYIPYAKENYLADHLDIFTPFVDSVLQPGLELYLAREYARLMQGDVVYELLDENDSAFVVDVKLYVTDPSEMRHYRLPSKKMTGHSVLLVDDHKESAMAVKKMFEYFKNEVDLLSSKELFGALDILDDYDIVVIQERFFSSKLVAKLQEIKDKRMIKVVSLNKNEEFEHSDAETIEMIDAELYKPVIVQKVFDLLVALYQKK